MTHDLLSILIPVYNPGPWLRKILDKLKSQMERHPNVEIIIVDDGSTEDVSWVIEYPGVKAYTQSNHGEAYTRNVCLSFAEGEYIQWIDHDDEIYDNFLDVIFENMRAGYDYVTYEFDTDHDRRRSYHNYGIRMINCAMWGYSFRAEMFDGFSFRKDLVTGCDVELLQRMLREDCKTKHDERVIYNYRWDGNVNSMCHRKLRGEI